MYCLNAQFRISIAVPIMNSNQKLGLVVVSDDVELEGTSIELDSICNLAAILHETTTRDPERIMLNTHNRMQRSMEDFDAVEVLEQIYKHRTHNTNPWKMGDQSNEHKSAPKCE